MIISPGSRPGSWSPSPWKTIFWPSFIPGHNRSKVKNSGRSYTLTKRLVVVLPLVSPLSMWTSKIFFCRRIFRPPHALQRSLWLILCPCPWQLEHTVDTCWTIPGSSWWTRTCIPVPWQDMHTCAAPLRLPRPAREQRPQNGGQQSNKWNQSDTLVTAEVGQQRWSGLFLNADQF